MKQESFSILRERMLTASKDKRIPLRVSFELTYRCNFKCRHCYVPASYQKEYRNKELSTREVFVILDQLAEAGCLYLGFTGGEPFARSDILSIFAYAKKKGFQCSIGTNGSLITDRIAGRLADLAPHRVDITIPSLEREAFGRITGTQGMYEKVFAAIPLFVKRKVNLGFRSCFLKENHDEISRIRKFAFRLGAMYRLDTMLVPRLNGDREPYHYRGRLQPKVLRSSLSRAATADFCKSAPVGLLRHQVKDIFYCGAGSNQVALTPAGELKLCLLIEYPKYSIRRASFAQAWEKLGKSMEEPVDRSFACDRCILRRYCKWCPAKSWLYEGNFTGCVPVCRQFAYQAKRLSI